MKYIIEDNVPVPARLKTGRAKSAFRKAIEGLNVGQSFASDKSQPYTCSVANAETKDSDGKKKFTVRKYDGGVRVWRIA